MMMIITAMILATGPSIDSRMDCKGASQGIDDPEAWAAGASASVRKLTDTAVAMWRRMRKACWIMTGLRSEEHTSELQSLMRNSYAVFCLKKKTQHTNRNNHSTNDYH